MESKVSPLGVVARCKKCDGMFDTPTLDSIKINGVLLTPRCVWCGSTDVEKVTRK